MAAFSKPSRNALERTPCTSTPVDPATGVICQVFEEGGLAAGDDRHQVGLEWFGNRDPVPDQDTCEHRVHCRTSVLDCR